MTQTVSVASFPPPIPRNPYQAILYRHLAAEGVALEPEPALTLDWLWRNRRRVATLHFHWPELYYRHVSSVRAATTALSWLRFGIYLARLVTARRLGYRLVWTVHQLRPHESFVPRLDSVAARALARLCSALIVHDGATAERVGLELGSGAKTTVVPHGSYVGVYPPGRGRDETRAALGIPVDAFVALSFGQVRRYKDLGLLVDAFRRAAIERGVLLIAGLPTDQVEARRLEEDARANPFLRLLLEYVPDERVAELYAASDVAVSSRSDGGTSGALVLALSMGVPVVAAAPALEASGGRAIGWSFEPGNPVSLASALRDAAEDRAGRAEKARAGFEQVNRVGWREVAVATAAVLRPA